MEDSNKFNRKFKFFRCIIDCYHFMGLYILIAISVNYCVQTQRPFLVPSVLDSIIYRVLDSIIQVRAGNHNTLLQTKIGKFIKHD